MLRLSGGINRGAVLATVCAVATMLACATTPESDPAASPDGSAEAVVEGSSQELARVDVESLAGETRIVLEGLQDPVYTVDGGQDGSPLVIELPGVRQPSASLFDAMSDAATQVSVYDGLVDAVSASTYEGDGAPATRVEISLTVPVQHSFESTPDGLAIVIRPDTSVARTEGEIDAIGADDLAGEIPAEAVPAEGDPWATAESLGGIDGEAAAATSDTIPGETTDALADGGAIADFAASEPAPSVPASTLRGVSIETLSAGVLVHLDADGMLGSAETFTLDNPDRLVVDLPGIANASKQDKLAVSSEIVSRVRIGAHPGKLRVVVDGGAASAGFQGRRILPTENGLIVTVGSGSDLDEALAARVSAANAAHALAAADAATPAELIAGDNEAEISDADIAATIPGDAGAPASLSDAGGAGASGSLAADDSTAEIFGLQLDRDGERDRIAVLSDRTVDYQVLTPDAETVVLSIENARVVGGAGERITPEAGGPISLVTAFQQPDVAQAEVRVVVRRAAGLEPRITRRGSLLIIDFPNTGLAASPPPAFIPGEPAQVAQGEQYANALEVSETAPVAIDDAASSQLAETTAAGDALAATTPVDDDYAAPSALAEAAALGDAGPIDALGAPMPEASSSAVPASLEGPAAVDLLEEGGLIDGKKYVGRRISLDFKDVLIADVLRLIAEVSDLNIIAGDEVQGTVTIRLVDVPWDQALDVVLLTKGLGFVRVGNVLRIAPAEILKVEEEVRLQERRNKEKLEDLEVKLQPVNYATVDSVQDLVRRLLSPRGSVNTDKRTNTLIIKDISSVIDEASALIQAIDTQTPQVLIEAKIVEANLEFGRELGSTWGVGSQPWVDGFNPGTPRTDLGGEDFKWAGANNVLVGNPITSVATGAVNFGAFLIDEKMAVEVHIEAMERSGDGKVISSPRVVTLDNREATIEQGVSIPFQTFEGGDAKLEFIDAVLSLKVTPHITADKSIIMKLEVTRNAPDASVSTPTGSPAIAKNQAKTETLVKDGQTLVIGGIYTIDKSTRESRVPYLHKIPVLGAAFKSREISDIRKELLIFVTPRVVVNPALADNG